ncbi:MAG: PhnD/SsuA/transferrin family substrate-binding protein [Pseudomonadota bacterium]
MTGKRIHGIAGSPALWKPPRAGLMILLFLAVCRPVYAGTPVGKPGAGNDIFRFVISRNMLSEVKVEDTRAAMKVWIQTVAATRQIPIDPEPGVYDNLEEMIRALRDNAVDGFNVTTEECWRLSKAIKPGRVVVGVNNDQIMEEYVILVRRDKGFKSIDDLRSRSLRMLDNPRMSLAVIWLDSLLLGKGLNPATTFCGPVTSAGKLSQTVLPVFFGQSDACLVTRRGFHTMSELNPQVGNQLDVLAASPGVVPTVFAFRADSISPFRDLIIAEMERLPETPAGQQILTLIMADRIEERPMACLDSAFDLLTTYHGLISARSRDKAGGGRLLKTETQPGGKK